MEALSKWIGYGVALSTPFAFGLWIQSFDTKHQLLAQKLQSHKDADTTIHKLISVDIKDNAGMIITNSSMINELKNKHIIEDARLGESG